MPRLMLAFFVSGFAALLCQVAWQRMLGIFAGSDTVSAALVVGAFLLGLGLGSVLSARVADRLSPARALVGFALCEGGVALFALLSKVFLYDVLAIGLAGVVDAPAAVFALCFAGLVLPTTLMGASLPLLSRAVATSLEVVAQRIGRLYGLNTLGAGLGALLGGWILLGMLGFTGALQVAAGLELLAAAIALTLLPAMRGRQEAAPAAAGAGAVPADAEPSGSLRLWCLLVFLSGFVIVALEIVWVRIVGQVGRFSAYLFPTVLGVFLLADGLGMAVAAQLVRRLRDPRRAFFLTQGGGFVLAAVLIGALWLALPYWPLNEYMSVEKDPTKYHLLILLALTGVVVGPPSLLIGMTFPFVQRAVQRDLSAVGHRVGWVQFANIAGNAAGSIGTGLLSLHLLGTTGTLRLLALLSLLLLLGWLWRSGTSRLRGQWPAVGLAAACALVLLVLPGNADFWRRMHAHKPGDFAAWDEDRSGIAFYRHRTDAAASGSPEGLFFITGYAWGTIPFSSGHLLLGALGSLLHPDPQRVLFVGVGSGATPWGALVSPAVRELRAVELIGPVLSVLREVGAARPEGAVAALWADPRVRLEYGDGRRALSRGTERYDVIEADAVRPETSHSGMLYSREFMRQVRHRLAPGGLYVQWAPTERVVATFTSVFEHALLVKPVNIVVGSDRPIAFDPVTFAERLRDPAVARHMARGNPASRLLPEMTAAIAAPPQVWGPGDARDPDVLTDMRPRDEFFLNNPSRYLVSAQPSQPPPEAGDRTAGAKAAAAIAGQGPE